MTESQPQQDAYFAIPSHSDSYIKVSFDLSHILVSFSALNFGRARELLTRQQIFNAAIQHLSVSFISCDQAQNASQNNNSEEQEHQHRMDESDDFSSDEIAPPMAEPPVLSFLLQNCMRDAMQTKGVLHPSEMHTETLPHAVVLHILEFCLFDAEPQQPSYRSEKHRLYGYFRNELDRTPYLIFRSLRFHSPIDRNAVQTRVDPFFGLLMKQVRYIVLMIRKDLVPHRFRTILQYGSKKTMTQLREISIRDESVYKADFPIASYRWMTNTFINDKLVYAILSYQQNSYSISQESLLLKFPNLQWVCAHGLDAVSGLASALDKDQNCLERLKNLRISIQNQKDIESLALIMQDRMQCLSQLSLIVRQGLSPSPEWFEPFSKLTHLRDLSISGSLRHNEGWSHVPRLQNIRQLYLFNIVQKSLDGLHELQQLESLAVSIDFEECKSLQEVRNISNLRRLILVDARERGFHPSVKALLLALVPQLTYIELQLRLPGVAHPLYDQDFVDLFGKGSRSRVIMFELLVRIGVGFHSPRSSDTAFPSACHLTPDCLVPLILNHHMKAVSFDITGFAVPQSLCTEILGNNLLDCFTQQYRYADTWD